MAMYNRTPHHTISFCLKILALILVILSVISTVRGCMNAMKFPSGSFDFHYDTAKFISLRLNPYTEALNPSSKSKELGLEMYYGDIDGLQFPSMLPILMLFTPFEPMTANLLWCICNVFFSLGIAVLIKILFFDGLYHGKNSRLVYIIFAALLFTCTPFRNNIGNGQETIAAFFFFLLSLRLSEKNHRTAAGISLSLSFLKYTLNIPLALYYVYKRKYKEILLSILIHLVLHIAASIWLGASPVDLILIPLKLSAGTASAGFYDICSLMNIQSTVVSAVLFILMSAFVYYCSIKLPGHDYEVISMLAVFSLIFVYHRIYDYFILILPLIIVMTSNKYSLADKIITCLSIAYIFFFQRAAMTFCSESVYTVIHYVFAAVFYLMFFRLTYKLAKNM
mgnify:CR=1 FL=1